MHAARIVWLGIHIVSPLADPAYYCPNHFPTRDRAPIWRHQHAGPAEGGDASPLPDVASLVLVTARTPSGARATLLSGGLPMLRSSSRNIFLPMIAAAFGVLALGATLVAPAFAQNEFCAISGSATSCKPVQWCGPGPSELYSYHWEGPNGFVFEGPCFDASVTGTYTLTITRNSDGRVETCSKDFLFTPGDVPCGITGPKTVCKGATVELCGPLGDLEYTWEGPGGFSATTRCVTVGAGGTYTLRTGSTTSTCEAV